MDRRIIEQLAAEIAPWGTQEYTFEVGGRQFAVKLPNRRESSLARRTHMARLENAGHESMPIGDSPFIEGFLIEAESWLPFILKEAPDHWKAKDQPKDGGPLWDLGSRVSEQELGVVWCEVITHWPHITFYPNAVIEDADPLAGSAEER